MTAAAIRFACAVLFAAFGLASPVAAGEIRATLKSPDPVTHAWALRREQTPTGVDVKLTEGKVAENKLVFPDLAAGRYDLRLQTSAGIVEGWDALVPASDYEEEQPLDDAGRAALVKKMSGGFAIEFHDQAAILDMQGNIQHAAILLLGLRTRPFVESAGENRDTWVLRVDRWEWENPQEQTWVPRQERPYFAQVRERLKPEAYKAKSLVFARHLGGIELTAAKPVADLGTIVVPRVTLGVNACDPDGKLTTPIVLKPGAGGAATRPASDPREPATAKDR